MLLEADVWLVFSFLIANILFFVFRGYGVIRNSNRYRYRSVVVLVSLPLYDLLIVIRDLIWMGLPMFITAPIFVPIPISFIIIILTLIFSGLIFGFLRVMLLNRYGLAKDVVF